VRGEFIGLDEPVAQADDALAAIGHVLIVRDHDDGQSLFVQIIDELQDRLAGLRVKITRRLIGHDDRGIHDEGTGDGDALLLPAGQFLGAMRESIAEADEVQLLDRPNMSLLARHLLVEERDHHVVDDRQFADQVEGLEDEADLPSAHLAQFVVRHLGDVSTIKDVRPRGRAVEAAEDVHEGALARAGRAHDRNVLAQANIEVDTRERVHEDRTVRLVIRLANAAQRCRDA